MGLNKIISVIVNVKGATNMLQQILEPGQKAEKEEEEVEKAIRGDIDIDEE